MNGTSLGTACSRGVTGVALDYNLTALRDLGDAHLHYPDQKYYLPLH